MNNHINQKKILVFINDAGASAYICSIILNESNDFNWKVYAISSSPASKELEKNKISYKKFFLLDEINEIIKKENPNVVFYGTGWINFSGAIKESTKNNSIKTFALIDHWVNYKLRFLKGCLPDVILVADDVAKKKAESTFNSEVQIFQIKNYYLENIRYNYLLSDSKIKDSVVYISEPTKVKNNFLDFSKFEYELLEDILKIFNKVLIRLHPTEHKEKYNEIISKFINSNIKVIEPYKESLATTLSKSKLTIGIESTALYTSYLLGIKTISYIPNKYKEPSIPLPKKYILTNLEKLKDLDFSIPQQKKLNYKVKTFYEIVNLILKKNGY